MRGKAALATGIFPVVILAMGPGVPVSASSPTPIRAQRGSPGRETFEPKPKKTVAPGQTSILAHPAVRSPGGPSPEAADPVTLLLTKTPSRGSWDIALSWSGDPGPFNLTTSPDPSFQTSAQTLAQEIAGTSFSQPANPGRTLECFEVTNASTVSLAAQTLGYLPAPPPSVPQYPDTDYW